MQSVGFRPRGPGIAPGRRHLRNGVLSGRAASLARGRRSLLTVQATVQAPAAATPSSSSSSSSAATPAQAEQPVPLTPAQLQLLQQHKGPLVKIATHYHVNFGDCLRVIGSSPEFGAWKAADAPLMKWGEGDVWSLVMPLPPGDYEFKVVVQQANGNLIWEAGDDNRLVSVPDDAPVDSMLVSVCAFNIIDGTTTPRVQPVTADVVALLEAHMEQEAAAAEEAAAAAAEAAAAEAEKGRALQAAAAVAKAIATMDAEAEEKRPRTMSDSDSEEDDNSPAAPQRSRGGAPVVAAYATDAPLASTGARQQQQQPTSAKSNRSFQNEVDYYSAEAEAAVAKSSSKATPKPVAAEGTAAAATGVESAAPAAADEALQANREDSEKKSDEERGPASSAASVRAKLAKDKPVAVGFVPPQRAPAAPPSSVVAAFMKSVGGKVQEPDAADSAAAPAAAAQPTEEAAAEDVPAAGQSAAAAAAAAADTDAAPAKGSSGPLPKGWGPDAGASKFPARDTNTATDSDSGSAATPTPDSSSSTSSGIINANNRAAAASSFSSSLATPSAGTPPNSPSKQGQRPPSPGRGASHVVSAAAAAAVAAEWIQGVRNNEVMSAARQAEKAASELAARLQQARQRKSEAAAEADRLNETLKHSSLVKGVKDVAPADSSSSSGGGEAAAAASAAAPAAPAAPSVNGWMAAARSKIGMTDAGAPTAANSSSSTFLSPPPITPVSGGSAAFAAASTALSATASVAVAGADMGPSPPPVIHAPGAAATAKRPAVSTQAVSAGGAALAAASGAAAYGGSMAGAGAGGGALEGGGSAGGDADAAGADEGMKFLASVVGCAAVGTVMWSEFVLKETGCGLPPGPYGLLGAAEGLSYLAVLGFAGAGAGARYKSGGKQGLPGPLAVPETLAYGALGAGLIVLASQLYTYGYIPPALPGDQCYADAAVAMPGAAELNMQLAALQSHVDDFSDYVGTQAAVLDAAWQLGLLELQDSLLNTTDAVSAFVDTHLQQLDLSGKLGHVLEILRAQEQQLKVELPQQLAELQQLAATSMAVVQETALHASSTAHLPELLSSLDHVMATLHGVLETRIQQLDVVLTQLQSSIGAAAGQLAGAVAAAQQSGSTEAATQLQGLQALLGDAMTDVQAQVWAGYQQLALADKLSDMLLTVRTSAAAVATSTATEVDKLRLQEQLQQLEGLAESSAAALAANAMDALHHMQLEERLQDIAKQASAAASSLQAGLQQQYKSQLPVVQAQLESLQAGIAQMSHKAQQQQVAGGPGGQELESLLKDLQVSMDSTMKLVGDVASSGATAAGDAMQNAGDAASSSLAAVSEQLGAATDAVSSSLAGVSSTTSSSAPAAADVASSVASVLPDTARVATQTATPVSSVLQQGARVAAQGLPAPIVTEAATPAGAFIVDTASISAAREAAAGAGAASGVPPESLAAAFGEAVESGMDFSSLVAYSLPEHRHILEALPTEQTFSVSSGVNLKDASDVMRSIWWHRPQ